ncbi:hypothetical protein [Frankia sp. AvcI1]|uniref:hypothetical protein n=1 Tax=Frankia sp. AvcI1 TaxID=573496 RepID=UPI0021178E38|nr:hypothetical protein [Frankia sp. AvcI1]
MTTDLQFQPPDPDFTISDAPETMIKVVTPALAAYWLGERNIHNRTASSYRQAGYSSEMIRGEWKFNGDPLRFDVNGVLLDGQHRLQAIARSGVALPYVIVVGLAPEAQETMDLGAKRTIGNILQLQGVGDPNNIAATAQLCWGYTNNTLGRRTTTLRRGTPAQVSAFVDDHGESLHTAVKQARALKRTLPVTISTAAAAYWIIARAAPESAARFWGPLLDGANLTPGSSILALRERLYREAAQQRKAETRQILAAFIKAWNAFVEDRSVKLLMWKDNEAYPRASRPLEG